jgi:hypothetical protein
VREETPTIRSFPDLSGRGWSLRDFGGGPQEPEKKSRRTAKHTRETIKEPCTVAIHHASLLNQNEPVSQGMRFLLWLLGLFDSVRSYLGLLYHHSTF